MKIVYLVGALISFILVILAIVLPVIPITPFLILGLFCVDKGFPKINEKFKQSKFYLIYVKKYLHEDGMYLKDKIKVLLLMATLILISVLIFKSIYVLLSGVVVLLIQVYIFLFKIDTKN